MKLKLVCGGVLIFAAITFAQTPTSPDLHLRGDR